MRNVYLGTALIEGRAGTIEVAPGDTIQGLGRVRSIHYQDGRWIVVTSRGVITSAESSTSSSPTTMGISNRRQ